MRQVVDVHDSKTRSFNMSMIRGADTTPEKCVRSILHGMGYRFRIHVKGLPGKPDIVMKKYNTIIFVHGCFWHAYKCKYGRVKPETNKEFWAEKISSNVIRDKRNIKMLKKEGWEVLIVWECELKDETKLFGKLVEFLS